MVPAVVEQGVGAELGVRDFLFELGGAGEHEEAVAVLGVPCGCGEAEGFPWAAPVPGAAVGVDEGPAGGDEDVCPVGFVFVVVPGSGSLEGVAVGGGDGEGLLGGFGGVFVEGGEQGVEGFAFVGGDGGDG